MSSWGLGRLRPGEGAGAFACAHETPARQENLHRLKAEAAGSGHAPLASMPGQAAPEAPTTTPARPTLAIPGAAVPELHVLDDRGMGGPCRRHGDAGSRADLRQPQKSSNYKDTCQSKLLQHDGRSPCKTPMADGSALRQRGTGRGVPAAQQNWRWCGFDRLAKVHRRCCTSGSSPIAAQSQARLSLR